MSALPEPASFLSGESGSVVGRRLKLERAVADWACDLAGAASFAERRLDRLADGQPRRSVLVLSIYRPGSQLGGTLEELRAEGHDVRLAFGAVGDPDPRLAPHTELSGLTGGKFENLNRLHAEVDRQSADWTIVVDDDVALPRRFLARFVAVLERLRLDLAQPAQTWRSHAAWRVTRRRPLALARRTAYVEIGPVTAFSRRAAAELLPFPELRFGWGLDNHWAAIARDRGWRLGVIDALPVRHETQQVAATYTHAEAIEEARSFLAGRPYITSGEAQRTLATIRRLGR